MQLVCNLGHTVDTVDEKGAREHTFCMRIFMDKPDKDHLSLPS